MANEFVIKNGYFSQGNSNVTGSLQVTGSVGVTGSVSITQNLTASKALISSSGNEQLMVMGSGSDSWITGIYGSQGNLLTVTDTFSGSIFTVSDISGYPILDITSNYYTGSIYLPTLQSQSQQNVVVYDSQSGLLSYVTASALGGGGGGPSTTINNNVDNYIITATGTANTLNGEANLQFNGSTLTVTGNITATSITGSLTGSLVGSLTGTASWAQSASQAVTASYVTGSIFTSTNLALSASNALTASYVLGPATFGVTIDGAGGVISAGQKGYVQVPYACTINSWRIIANTAGSTVIDVTKAAAPTIPTVSITGSAPPTLTAQQTNASPTLTGWTTSVAANDIIGFNVISATTVSWVTLQLFATKT